jgi:hypothetical protein
MKFELALKKINAGMAMTRPGASFELKKEKNAIMRLTRNGGKTIARIPSKDLLAEDWEVMKAKKAPKAKPMKAKAKAKKAKKAKA